MDNMARKKKCTEIGCSATSAEPDSNRRRPGHTRGGIEVGRIDFVRAHSRHPLTIASEEQNPRDIIPIRSIFFACGVHVCHDLPNVIRAALGGSGGSLQSESEAYRLAPRHYRH